MCIIVVKKKNLELPKKETLKTCFEKNSDGAGYMYAKNKQVIIKKGFFSFEEFYKNLKNDYDKNNLKNQNLVLHFRIGTSGGINKEKTHPFILTNNKNLIDKVEKVNYCKSGVVHNGIFNDYCYERKFSDTQNYIMDFLYPLSKKFNFNFNDKLFKICVNNSINTSKLVILNYNDELSIFGNFEEEEGILYSNSTYKKIDYSSYYKNLNLYDSYYDDYYYNQKKANQDNFNENEILTSYKEILEKCVKVKKGEIIYFEDYTEFEVKNNNNVFYYYDANFNIYEVNFNNKICSFIGTAIDIY